MHINQAVTAPTAAEFSIIAEKILALKPASLSHIEASTIPCVALTAHQAITQALQMKSGESILITGGAGGVGSFAVQIASYLGAQVIATASAAKHDYLRGLGANMSLTIGLKILSLAQRSFFPRA